MCGEQPVANYWQKQPDAADQLWNLHKNGPVDKYGMLVYNN